MIYDNILLLGPNGEKLCYINKKRAKFYLDRQLADSIKEDCIKLNFTPKGFGHLFDNEYYLQKMKNLCVVCGSKNDLNRHHIVPLCYRTHFPHENKTHSWYDILPLCYKCHRKYEVEADKIKLDLVEKYDAPLDLCSNDYFKSLSKIKQYSNTLLKHNKVLPSDKLDMMIVEITKFLGKIPDQNDLKELSGRKLNFKNLDIEKHGSIVVSKLDNIEEFCEFWRQHFLDTMQPKFLPFGWGVKKPERKI